MKRMVLLLTLIACNITHINGMDSNISEGKLEASDRDNIAASSTDPITVKTNDGQQVIGLTRKTLNLCTCLFQQLSSNRRNVTVNLTKQEFITLVPFLKLIADNKITQFNVQFKKLTPEEQKTLKANAEKLSIRRLTELFTPTKSTPTAAVSTNSSATSAEATAVTVDDTTEEETVSLTFVNDDNATSTLKRRHANCAQTCKDFLNDFGGAAATPTIPLSVSATDFDLLTPFWEDVYEISRAQGDEKIELEKQLSSKLELIDNRKKLGNIVNIASYLGIKSLIDCGLQAIQKQILSLITSDDFMDEPELEQFNPYNLNKDLNRELIERLIQPAVLFLDNVTSADNIELYHSSPVKHGSFSSNGRYALTVSGNAALLFDTNDPAQKRKFKNVMMMRRIRTFEHSNTINSACFNNDATAILTTSDDGTAKLWDFEGSCLATMNHTSNVVNGCFNHKGTMMLTTSNDKTTKLWDLKGNCLATMNHTDKVSKGSFSPDDQTVLTISNKVITFWNLDGKVVGTFSNPTIINSGTFNPSKNIVLITSWDSTAKLVDCEGNCLFTLTGHTKRITSGSFNSNGSEILTTSLDGTAKTWDLSGNCLRTLSVDHIIDNTDDCKLTIKYGCFSPNNKYILTVFSDARFIGKLWDINTGKCAGDFIIPFQPSTGIVKINSSCFSPDGKSILTTSENNRAYLWNQTQQRQILTENCTLAQAILLAHAYAKDGFLIGDSYQKYGSIISTFDPETLEYIKPIIRPE